MISIVALGFGGNLVLDLLTQLYKSVVYLDEHTYVMARKI
jgi:hypothetical protein